MNKLIIANWKSNPKTVKEAEGIISGYLKFFKDVKNKELVIIPPSLFLFLGNKIKSKKIFLGSQNIFPETESSVTGEVFSSMLKSLNISYVIVGHSERRSLGESDNFINSQIKTILKGGMTPILCVGEKNRDEDGDFLSSIKNQLKTCLDGVNKSKIKNIIIAYEPIWAIGKDAVRQASPEEFIEMKIYIRKILSDIYGPKTSSSVKIIYGGSVNSNNAEAFISAGADGLLVGRDSLDIKKFETLIKSF
jgi:triosephosphate isomerase (TIM)